MGHQRKIDFSYTVKEHKRRVSNVSQKRIYMDGHSKDGANLPTNKKTFREKKRGRRSSINENPIKVF